MADVFLSYAHEDTDVMRRVRGDLRSEGFDVWVDETGLQPGTPEWQDAIEQAIEGAGCLVVLLTPNAKQKTWVGREVAYATALGLSVIPVLAKGNARNAIPIDLIDAQRIEIGKDYAAALRLLVGTVGNLLGRPGYEGVGLREAAAYEPPDPQARHNKVRQVARALEKMVVPLGQTKVTVGLVTVKPNYSPVVRGQLVATILLAIGGKSELPGLGWKPGGPPSRLGRRKAGSFWRDWPPRTPLGTIAEDIVAANEAMGSRGEDLKVTSERWDITDI